MTSEGSNLFCGRPHGADPFPIDMFPPDFDPPLYVDVIMDGPKGKLQTDDKPGHLKVRVMQFANK